MSSVTLHLEPGEVAALRERRTLQSAQRLKDGTLWKDPGHDLVFTTRYGRPLQGKEIFGALLKQSGFTGRTNPYGMRHGGISEVAGRYGLKEAQVLARHKLLSTTADGYIDVADRRIREVSQSMGALVLASTTR